MTKDHIVGLRYAALIALCAGSASVSLAQSPPEMPQYYSYELCPAPSTGYVHDSRFQSALRNQLWYGNRTLNQPSQNPVQAAQVTVSQFLDRTAEGTIDLDPSLVCITLQNFGSKAATPFAWGTTEFSFFRDDDKLSGFPGDNVLPYLQPWMQTAVGIFNPTTQQWEGGDATNWMENYLDALAVLLSNTNLPPITIPRFHCEVETSLTQGRADNGIVQVMLACEQDDRWESMPVPGFGGDTMLEIWQDAQDFYNWRDPVTQEYRTLAAAMIATQRADSDHNKPYYAWWINVCRRALDGAIKITCYDVIDNHPIYGGAKSSNYGYANMDMGQDTFTFRSSDGVSGPTSTWYRGKYFFYSSNAYPQILAATSPPLAWGLEPDVASGNFDAPEVYFGGSIDESVGLRQRRWYERPDPVTGLQRLETSTECYLRAHRHHLDSVFHTPSRAPDGVTPWIDLPNAYSLDGHTNGIDETRRVLALLRSKDIREVLLFGNKRPPGWQEGDPLPNPARGELVDWNILKRADAQVYAPYISLVLLNRGSAPGNVSEQSLNTTLRSEATPELVVESEYAGSPSHHHVTEIVTIFENIRPQDLGNNGRLVLECRVEPKKNFEGGKAWREAIRGQISIWNNALAQWEPLQSVHDQAAGEYGFYLDNELANSGSTETRREWDLGYDNWPGLCDYLLNDVGNCEVGGLAFKFTHLAPELPSGFVSKYDLVMFYHLDDHVTPLEGGEPLGLMASSSSTASVGGFLTADFNFDGVQDATDAGLFVDAWSNGERRADYNADGEVDALDLTQFLGALSRATGAGGSSEW